MFNAELVYIRTNFPMGKVGLKLKDGVVTPNGQELAHLMALWGAGGRFGDGESKLRGLKCELPWLVCRPLLHHIRSRANWTRVEADAAARV